MQQGSFLVDTTRGEQRFRVDRLLAEDDVFQVARAEDTANPGATVCACVANYDADRAEDPAYVAARRQLVTDARDLLQQGIDGFPHFVAWLELATDDGDAEPVLVYEQCPGVSLYALVTHDFSDGLEPMRALGIFNRLAEFLGRVHAAGYILRKLDPRDVIVGEDDELRVVGFGYATKKGERPNDTLADVDSPYVAPEVRSERSGKLLRAAADVYTLGAVMSFMLTGEEPRLVVEGPLNVRAYQKINAIEPEGLTLLTSKCIQPMAKNRFGNIKKLLPHSAPDALPTRASSGFRLEMLPAPWVGVENPEKNRALMSRLSAGPLISVASDEPATKPLAPTPAVAQPDEDAEPVASMRGLVWALITGVFVALVVAAAVLLQHH